MLTLDRNTPPSDDPASHENEGFLKSVWHKMTHHPAHEKKPDGEPTSSTEESSTKKTKDEEPKKKSDSA